MSEATQAKEFNGEEGLSLKIALGSYRMFFIPETEDYFHRTRSQAEIEKNDAREAKVAEGAKTSFHEDYSRPRSNPILS